MPRFDFNAIGTKWRIDIPINLDVAKAVDVLAKVKARIDLFDRAYSRFREDSLVTRMSKESGTFTLPDDAAKMFAIYWDIYKLIDGLVTPLIGNLISDAGYDASYSLRPKKDMASPPKWEEALDYMAPDLTVKKPVMLDFGAAGKGYLVDLVAEVLEANGISEYLIDAGGDIIHRGKPATRVGLEDPEDQSKVIGVYELGDGSICGSAGNRRKWADFTHIINPQTRVSPTEISAVWVLADSTLVADALATCLFFVPADRLAASYDFEYLIVRSDRSIEKSDGFSAELFV